MYYCNQYLHALGRRIVQATVILCVTLLLPLPLKAEAASNDVQTNQSPDFTRTTENYLIPDVVMTGKGGKKISFLKALDDGRPVILNFIFVSCSSICPMLSHEFAMVQTKLGKNKQKVHLISVSIDPENDTPAKLAEYGKKFKAGPDWDYYTGTLEASIAIQKAFHYFRGDKMNHSSAIFMRAAPGKPWVRLEGFASSDAVINEIQSLTKN